MANGIAGDGVQHPLSRWQVLEEESAVLSSSPPNVKSIWLFEEADLIRDAKTGKALLEEVLQNSQDPLSQKLANEWKKTQDLVKALNTLVCDSQLYSEQRFPLEELTEDAREAVRMIECQPQGDDLIYWNRIFLESMYSEMLRKIEECVVKRLHEQNRTALCFSGGGIRSATFNLGILQGLTEYDLLEKFDYLSTVSGGGYIGSWLSAWIFHEGMESVVKELKYPRRSKIDPEYAPVRHLREYSNYLTPEWGLLSADTWTWVAIYLRNLLLNWLVLVSLFAAALLVPRLAVAVV